MNSLTKYLMTSVSLSLLAACGENTVEKVTQTAPEDMMVVSNVSELPPCELSNKGEQVWVKAESLVRVCSDGFWYSTVAGTTYVQGTSLECSAKKLEDAKGFKILCNGDSVGVVRNGNDGVDGINGTNGSAGIQGIPGEKGDDGAPGKQGLKGDDGDKGNDGTDGENGSGCSVKTVDEYSVQVICGSDSTILYIPEQDSLGSQEPGADPVILDSEKVAVSLNDVSGVSQKGPFLSGSKVRAYEILDGRTLEQSGNSFNGKIQNDNGEFKINARTLVSQYLSLEATGFYRNEVTGKNSDVELTLSALTDVSARNVANINLLTHLEYERVHYLVTQKKMKVKAAKKQAQKEVFDILHIDATSFENSEDLNVTGNSDGDGALLAFSVLLQGDRSVSELSELLTKIANDMETDGTWDDAATKLLIADWAADADSAGRLDSVRRNVEKWGLSSEIPDFEKHVRHFRDVEYKLGTCDGGSHLIVKAPLAGKRKNSKTRYICDGNKWRVADDMEKDTYLWESGVAGEIRAGSINTDKFYLFDGIYLGWRNAFPADLALGACIPEIENDVDKKVRIFEDAWWICKNYDWIEVALFNETFFGDTLGWNKGADGDVKKGKLTDAYYVYDEIEGGWRKVVNEYDYTLDFGGCTEKRVGEYKKNNAEKKYYVCTSDEGWTVLKDKTLYNTDGLDCDEDGKMVLGLVDTKTYFVCENGEWREATINEELAGESCIVAKNGRFNKDSSYICDNGESRKATFYDYPIEKDWTNPDKTYGTLYDDRDGRSYKTIEINGLTVMAENLNYADSNTSLYLKENNWCYMNDSVNCLKGGRYYTWTAALNIDPKWQEANVPEGMVGSPHQGICPNGWHIPTPSEFNVLISDNWDGFAPFQSKGNVLWKEATDEYGFSALPVGANVDAYYQYEYDNRYWDVGKYAHFWTVTDDGYGGDYARSLSIRPQRIDPSGEDKRYGLSVRCFKDQPASAD